MIRFSHVAKSFDARSVLREVTLTLDSGQTHVILGESGCGKSTLLRLIMGLLAPDHGTVSVAGVEVTPQNCRQIRRQIGYVLQHAGLFPHFTARQNVALMAELDGWSAPDIEARIRELVSLVGLDLELLDSFPQQISGGERQRVGVMRALMRNPPVLLLDEPMAALDPIMRNRLQQDLVRIFSDLQKTVVMVTHDLREAAYLAHTVTLLNQGEIVQHGSFPELLRQPASSFVTAFVRAQESPRISADEL